MAKRKHPRQKDGLAAGYRSPSRINRKQGLRTPEMTFRSRSWTTSQGRIVRWCRTRDSNPRPIAYEAIALPAELVRRRGSHKRSGRSAQGPKRTRGSARRWAAECQHARSGGHTAALGRRRPSGLAPPDERGWRRVTPAIRRLHTFRTQHAERLGRPARPGEIAQPQGVTCPMARTSPPTQPPEGLWTATGGAANPPPRFPRRGVCAVSGAAQPL